MSGTASIGSLSVSRVGLGCNNFGRDGSLTRDLAGTRAVIDAAIEHGVTFFDTAALYGGPDSLSEALIGQALEGRRDEVVIATKFGHTSGPEPSTWGARGSRDFIRKAADASLARLRTDRIDLFQIHEPDPDTPIEETLGALAELIEDGKVVEIGHSNFDADMTRAADDCASRAGGARFVTAQNEYSLLKRGVEGGLVAALEERGLGLLPYFPLASGLLTGKYRRGSAPEGSRLAARLDSVTDETWQRLVQYEELTGSLGVSELEASFGWLLAQPVVTSVIAGATTPEQVAANAAAGRVRLDADAVAQIDAIFS
ncbi:MAG: aldo/keto reductase [Actinomycetia bacterium]|nr:aldo/keto reductase [Actinomycetes bacterium]